MHFVLSNEPKINIVGSPYSHQRELKNANFRVKLHFTWRNSATKVICANTLSDKVVGLRHSLT